MDYFPAPIFLPSFTEFALRIKHYASSTDDCSPLTRRSDWRVVCDFPSASMLALLDGIGLQCFDKTNHKRFNVSVAAGEDVDGGVGQFGVRVNRGMRLGEQYHQS